MHSYALPCIMTQCTPIQCLIHVLGDDALLYIALYKETMTPIHCLIVGDVSPTMHCLILEDDALPYIALY